MTTETLVPIITLKVGDIFIDRWRSLRPIFKVVDIDDYRLKTIELTSYKIHAAEKGYVYFRISSSEVVTLLTNYGTTIRGKDLLPGDRVIPTAYFECYNDIMTVIKLTDNGVLLKPDEHVRGYARQHANISLSANDNYILYYREYPYGPTQILSNISPDKELDITGFDAYIEAGESYEDIWVHGAKGSVTFSYNIRDIVSNLRTLNLMSEDEFKKKHSDLQLRHWKVFDDGPSIRVACPQHHGENFNKLDIKSFMRIMQRILEEKKRTGLTPEEVYEFINKNQARLGL